MAVSIVRWTRTGAAFTPTAAAACAPFGVLVDRADTTADPRLDLVLPDAIATDSGAVTAITGPSGSGKSTMLRALERRLLERGDPVVVARDPPDDARPIVDLLSGPIEHRVGTLARAGLAEAMVLPKRAGELSEGERARLRLALAFDAAERLGPGAWVLCDELCSVLDRATAQSVARTLRRWARASSVRVVGASAHEDLPRLLGPDRVVELDARGGAAVRGPVRPAPVRVRLETGGIADYDALAPHHYRGGRPATRVLVRRAIRTMPGGTESLAGVLVVSMPTLNGAWRRHAWPGRFEGDKRRAASRINRDLRCLSRVVVDPASRGLGVARRLVEDYLAAPLTPATEAVAQMGAVCPFFERSGMRAYPLALGPDDARLLDALATAGLSHAELGVVSSEESRAAAHDGLVRREVARWARVRKVRGAFEGMGMPERIRAAAALASAAPVAYAYGG